MDSRRCRRSGVAHGDVCVYSSARISATSASLEQAHTSVPQYLSIPAPLVSFCVGGCRSISVPRASFVSRLTSPSPSRSFGSGFLDAGLGLPLAFGKLPKFSPTYPRTSSSDTVCGCDAAAVPSQVAPLPCTIKCCERVILSVGVSSS